MNRAGSVLCPILVGRDELLELADRRIAEVIQGRGQALLISGSAGLGKTRLMRAIARKALAAGLRVDGGSVAPQDHQVPLASIREFASGLRGNTAFGTLREDLLAIDGGHASDALGTRRLIVRGTADRILEAIDRPTLLIFDDLHWTDEVSLEVIGELARHAGDKPLLLLGGYRADEFPTGSLHREWRSRLLSQRYAEEVRLRALTLDETSIATTLIFGGELPAARDVVQAVHERTNGIPLHIEELLAALDDDARTDGRRIRDAIVPDTIGDAVLSRLSRLSDDARMVARAGAVVGRCFSPDVLAGMVDRPLADLEPPIQELVDAAILYPFDYIDHGYYDFRHQLLRDAIYGSVPPSQLRRFHAQAAEFVMTLEAASIIHASRHYERAGLKPQAFRSALTGAEESRRIGARSEQVELLRRALDNLPPDLPAIEKAEVYSAFSDAAHEVERHDESRRAALLAQEAFLAAGRPDKAAELRLNLWSSRGKNVASTDGQIAELNALLEDLDDLPQTPDTAHLRRITLFLRAHTATDGSRYDEALADVARVRELATEAGDRESLLEVDLIEERVKVLTGRAPTTMDPGFRAAEAARNAGFESTGVTGYRNLAVVAARVLDYDTSRRALTEGLQYADAIEASHCRQQMAVTRAHIAWAAGRWDDANEIARQEVAERGCRIGALSAMETIGMVAATRGDADAARRWLAEALDGGRVTGDVQRILPSLWGLAELELHKGDPTVSLAHCEEALAIATAKCEVALLVPFVVTGTRAALTARRPDLAEAWLGRCEAHITTFERIARPAKAHAHGLVHVAASSLAKARESLVAAVAGWEEIGRTWEAGWARLDLASCLLRMNRYAEAAPLLASVGSWADEVHSEPLRERVDELLRMSRGRGTADEPWRPLTIREFEVARLIADGLTNGEIAEQLDVAPKTASAHVEHILAKLGVTRRAEIAAWAAMIERPAARVADARAQAVGSGLR
ncbi:MAG TPA: AAA family ATPase [Candidatus Limnocylindrales bacterium]|nr:AAA family ATPase [Candidatus Limnocylindrales bacterium]